MSRGRIERIGRRLHKHPIICGCGSGYECGYAGYNYIKLFQISATLLFGTSTNKQPNRPSERTKEQKHEPANE